MYKNENTKILIIIDQINQIKLLARDTADSLLELEQAGFLSNKQSDIIAKKFDELFESRLKQILK